MLYAPHYIEVRREMVTRDALNRITESSDNWVRVCDCRCDDYTTEHVEDDNGRDYVPSYSIASDKTDAIKEGEEIRCIDKTTGGVRGEGRIVRIRRCNYLDYMTVYV